MRYINLHLTLTFDIDSTYSFKSGLNIMRKEFNSWASLWTDWSVWPDGLTCSELDPLEQVRPHLVSKMPRLVVIHTNAVRIGLYLS